MRGLGLLCTGGLVLATGLFAQQNVLVVRDHLPNGGDAVLEFQQLGASVTEIAIQELPQTVLDPYCVVCVTAIDQQPGSFPVTLLEQAIPQFEAYVGQGGVLFYETGVDFTLNLPLGVVNEGLWDWENMMVPGHPVAASLPGFLSANCAAFSYGTLENLPPFALPISMTSWSGQVVSASLAYGSGEMILTGILGEYGLPSANCWLGLDDPGRLWLAIAEYCLSLCDEGTVEAAELPGEFRLDPAHPNPFNPATTLSYSLPESAEVELAVYALDGRRVATLVSGLQAAGEHELFFDAAGLASGSYVARLSTPFGEHSQKLLLLK